MPAWKLTVSPPLPAAPGLALPFNGFRSFSPTPSLSWSLVGSGNTYQVQIARNYTFTSLVQSWTSGVDGTGYTATALPGGTYYWRVRTVNLYGVPGAWAAYRYFVVDLTPPALYTPANNATTSDTTPTLTVLAKAGAQAYEFQVATDSGFDPLYVIDDQVVSTTYYIPTTPYATGAIYWRVRAQDKAANWSGWSAIRKLTIY